MADELHLKLFTPSQMTDAERAEFINLVLLGDQVNRHTLPHLIDHAETLVGLYLNEVLVGTAAIKNPHPEHREGDFCKAGVADQATDYPFELGWIVTHPKHRSKGLARKLVLAALNASPGSVYATTKTDRMIDLLPQLGFTKIGTPFPSVQDKNATLILYVKDIKS